MNTTIYFQLVARTQPCPDYVRGLHCDCYSKLYKLLSGVTYNNCKNIRFPKKYNCMSYYSR
jgi:hypothetical protein